MTSTASLSRKCNPQEEPEDQLGTQGTGEGGRSGIRGLFGKRTALGEVSFLGQILLVYRDTVFDKGTESNDWRSKFPVTVAVAWNGFRGPLTALVNSQLSLLLGYNGFLQRQVVALSAAAEVADEELDCVSYKTYLEFLQKMRG